MGIGCQRNGHWLRPIICRVMACAANQGVVVCGREVCRLGSEYIRQLANKRLTTTTTTNTTTTTTTTAAAAAAAAAADDDDDATRGQGSRPKSRDEHFKFHKVVQRHYSGEEDNVCMILQQIYSRNRVPNFVKFARVLWKILLKCFGLFFPRTPCSTV